MTVKTDELVALNLKLWILKTTKINTANLKYYKIRKSDM